MSIDAKVVLRRYQRYFKFYKIKVIFLVNRSFPSQNHVQHLHWIHSLKQFLNASKHPRSNVSHRENKECDLIHNGLIFHNLSARLAGSIHGTTRHYGDHITGSSDCLGLPLDDYRSADGSGDVAWYQLFVRQLVNTYD